MILVVVGTSPYPFDRLIKKIDQISSNISSKVFIQRGSSKYTPINCDYIDFVDRSEMISKMEKSDLVIAQGGYGTLMDAISLDKMVIAVPRYEKYRELVGDQTELVDYLEEKKCITACNDIALLENLISNCLNGSVKFEKYQSSVAPKISKIVSTYILESC